MLKPTNSGFDFDGSFWYLGDVPWKLYLHFYGGLCHILPNYMAHNLSAP